MNILLKKLAGGSLISDSNATEVADEVLKNPKLFDKLVEGLSESDAVIRARTAHALERISRTNPELVYGCLNQIIELSAKDRVPMVKWHIAMILGNLTYAEVEINTVVNTLLLLLSDDSVFVKSWAISSLAILGRAHKNTRIKIIKSLKKYQKADSIAIKSRVAKALKVLEHEHEPIPATWLKRKD